MNRWGRRGVLITKILIIERLFLVQIQVVPIHNNGDPRRLKGISKGIGEYAHAHSQLPQSRWL